MIRYKYILTMLLLIVFTSMCLASETKKKPPVVADKEDFKEIQVGFFFGPGYPQFDFENSGSDSYSAHWHDFSPLTRDWVRYDIFGSFSSSIAGDSERGFGLGGFFNYFFRRNVGFQFMLERSSYDVPVGASHAVDMSMYMVWGDKYFYSAEPSISGTVGSLTVMPISFNGIGRFEPIKNISAYASGGLTYYKANIEAESRAGFGFPYFWYNRTYDLDWLLYDSALVPVNIDDSINGAGVNVGGGVVYKILEKIEIVADFRYYLGPKKDVYWTPRPGNYTLLMNDWEGSVTMILTQTEIDTFLAEYGELFKVEVNPSFYRFAFGLQFRFW